MNVMQFVHSGPANNLVDELRKRIGKPEVKIEIEEEKKEIITVTEELQVEE